MKLKISQPYYFHKNISSNLDDFIWNEKLANYYKNTYLKNQKEFTVCVHDNLFPIDGVNQGKLNGISGDILNDIIKTI